ncbi:MAG TPA: lipoyl synthase [Spirochaetes bacterium]|nr:lipoyl synthase [Spirochaetota bacterium]
MERVRTIPDWIRFSIPAGENYVRVKRVLEENSLHTVCTEARCPNIGECLGRGTATFLIMGPFCSRNCRYCAVRTGPPAPLDPAEPAKIARAVSALKLSYAVITSVTRDDLPDGGAGHFADTVQALRERVPSCGIELLVPDFKNSFDESIGKVIAAGPNVINHNIEVARRLYREMRPRGDYDLSLRLIERVSLSAVPSKSGLMVGLGETMADIEDTLRDLRFVGCRALTVGQYLRSTADNAPVRKFYRPEEFDAIGEMARSMDFDHVMSAPLVRSSYRAGENGKPG